MHTRLVIIYTFIVVSGTVWAGESIAKNSKNPLASQWKILYQESEQQGDHTFISALSKENNAKNRYGNVLAADHSRVKLKSANGGSDYINANFVDGFHEGSRSAYIAAQAPLPGTFNDFWSMIWDQDVEVIVMLTKIEEHYVVKADQYWPDHRETKHYGDITVTLTSVQLKHKGQYRINTFTVQREGKTKTVRQYYFLVWPDHGVPSDAHPLLDMMNDIELERSDRQKTPMLIHCSAGIGRTGTFILIHSILAKMKHEQNFDTENLNLQPFLSKLRQQRSGSIQSYKQYVFSYQAIKTAIENKYEWINVSEVKDGHEDHLEAAREVKSIDLHQDIVIL